MKEEKAMKEKETMKGEEILKEVTSEKDQDQSRLSFGRRDFLKTAGVATPLVLLGDLWRPRQSWAGSEEIQYGGTFKGSVAGSPLTFDPNYYELYEEMVVGSLIFNRLVHLEPDMSVHPELAVSWEPNDDASVWTFKLRQDVKFHNGREFTAADVAAFFNRVADPDSGSKIVSELSPIAAAEVVDKYTVRMLLEGGYADWPVVVGKPRACIIAAESAGKDTRAPIGTGPYKFKEFLPGEGVVVEANKGTWEDGQPHFDEVRTIVYPDSAAATSALLAGDIDIRWEIEQEYIDILSKDPDVIVNRAAGIGYQNLIMDTNVKPFDDPRVIEAIKYCVDREAFVEGVLDGYGVVANDHAVSPMNPFFADSPLRQQDHKKAKELLTEAGYPDGLDIDVHCSEIRAGMIPSAITMKDQAAPAGIRFNVRVEPADGYWKEIWRKKPCHYSNWGGRPLIHDTLNPYLTSTGKWNESNWYNPTVDKMIPSAMSETDLSKRRDYYSATQALCMHSSGLGIPYFRDYIMAHRSNIRGFPLFATKWLFFNRPYRVKT